MSKHVLMILKIEFISDLAGMRESGRTFRIRSRGGEEGRGKQGRVAAGRAGRTACGQSFIQLSTAYGWVKSMSKHVFMIIYMTEFISECWNTLKLANETGADQRIRAGNRTLWFEAARGGGGRDTDSLTSVTSVS